MELGGVHHLAIRTRRVSALAGFYARTFRLEELRRNVDEAGLYSVWLRLGPSILMIERGDGPPDDAPFDTPSSGLHLVAFPIRADERAAWQTQLEQAGVPIVHRTAFTLYVRDPDGNRIGLSSWPERKSEGTDA